jgi:hypothetical protein
MLDWSLLITVENDGAHILVYFFAGASVSVSMSVSSGVERFLDDSLASQTLADGIGARVDQWEPASLLPLARRTEKALGAGFTWEAEDKACNVELRPDGAMGSSSLGSLYQAMSAASLSFLSEPTAQLDSDIVWLGGNSKYLSIYAWMDNCTEDTCENGQFEGQQPETRTGQGKIVLSKCMEQSKSSTQWATDKKVLKWSNSQRNIPVRNPKYILAHDKGNLKLAMARWQSEMRVLSVG